MSDTKSVTKQERGLCELYEQDPERADALVFGRVANVDRRGFLKAAGLTTMAAAVGATIPFHEYLPAGIIPAAFAEGTDDFVLPGKDKGLTILNDRPINAETPAHLLDDDITPAEFHFVRNNGFVPEMAKIMDAGDWSLTIDGEVENALTLTLEDLKKNFEAVTMQMQLECGGNGRASFNPPAKGNQWTVGAIANAEWTGVRLKDVLAKVGLKSTALYTAHYGADIHLSGNPDKAPISRGVPIAKALDEHCLIVYAMNGQPIPTLHGFPVRLMIPGWPGSFSHKWLTRIWLRSQVHDGPKMTGKAYRVPKYPVEPGTKIKTPNEMVFIESMKIKSLISFPKTGIEIPASNPTIEVRGHAWAGDNSVTAVEVTYDFGQTWVKTALSPPANRYAWQRWRAQLTLPMPGYYEIWARATDDVGRMQPFTVPGWNPKGYMNNAMHRIAVKVVG